MGGLWAVLCKLVQRFKSWFKEIATMPCSRKTATTNSAIFSNGTATVPASQIDPQIVQLKSSAQSSKKIPLSSSLGSASTVAVTVIILLFRDPNMKEAFG